MTQVGKSASQTGDGVTGRAGPPILGRIHRRGRYGQIAARWLALYVWALDCRLRRQRRRRTVGITAATATASAATTTVGGRPHD